MCFLYRCSCLLKFFLYVLMQVLLRRRHYVQLYQLGFHSLFVSLLKYLSPMVCIYIYIFIYISNSAHSISIRSPSVAIRSFHVKLTRIWLKFAIIDDNFVQIRVLVPNKRFFWSNTVWDLGRKTLSKFFLPWRDWMEKRSHLRLNGTLGYNFSLLLKIIKRDS